MHWKARERADQETYDALSKQVVDFDLLNDLERSYEDGKAAIEREEAKLQQVYAGIPALLAQVSELSGISQSDLLIICRRIAATSRDMDFPQVLVMINSFFRIKKSLEEKK